MFGYSVFVWVLLSFPFSWQLEGRHFDLIVSFELRIFGK